jgi:hypothetical protein
METVSAPSTIICKFCFKPMQIAEDVKNPDGKVIARRFICACKGTVYHWNWHDGQSPQTRGNTG